MIREICKNLVYFASVFVLVNCGGGDGGTPTPAPTSYSFSTEIKVLTPGYTRTFDLTGSNSDGDQLVMTAKVTVKSPTTHNGKSVTPIEFTSTLENITQNSTTSSTNTEYYSAGYVLEEIVYLSGPITCTPSSYTGMPDSATVGESGTIGVVNCDDGTTETGTWRLEASGDNAKLIQTYVEKAANGTELSSQDTIYLLNPSGNILGLELEYSEPSGFTISVSGK